jgi:uncharacterized protein YebE (UPF0316 family)
MLVLFLKVFFISFLLDIIHAFRTKATADSSILKASISAFVNGLFFFYSLTYMINGDETTVWTVIVGFSLGQAAGTIIGIKVYDKNNKGEN